MILYLVGISCVGKSTIGRLLAEKLNFKYYDLDIEIQNYYNTTIEKLQKECWTMNEYRERASIVLDHLFSKTDNLVIAGTPSGLKYSFLKVYKKHRNIRNLLSIHIRDSNLNVLNRLTFYDQDSNPVLEILDKSKKKKYLKTIGEDHDYFRESYKRADIKIDIENVPLNSVTDLIVNELKRNNIMPAANNSYTP